MERLQEGMQGLEVWENFHTRSTWMNYSFSAQEQEELRRKRQDINRDKVNRKLLLTLCSKKKIRQHQMKFVENKFKTSKMQWLSSRELIRQRGVWLLATCCSECWNAHHLSGEHSVLPTPLSQGAECDSAPGPQTDVCVCLPVLPASLLLATASKGVPCKASAELCPRCV